MRTVEDIKMKAILADVLERDGFGVRGRVLTVTYASFGSVSYGTNKSQCDSHEHVQ